MPRSTLWSYWLLQACSFSNDRKSMACGPSIITATYFSRVARLLQNILKPLTSCLPIDVSLGVTFDNRMNQPYTVYTENLCTHFQYKHDLGIQNAWKKVASNKKRYDAHISPGALLPVDGVSVKNLSPGGKNNLKDRWEDIHSLWQAVLETDLSKQYSKKAPKRCAPCIATCYFLIMSHIRPYTLPLQQAPTQHQVPIVMTTWKPSDWLKLTLMEVTRSWSPLLLSPHRKPFLTQVLRPLILLWILEKNKFKNKCK